MSEVKVNKISPRTNCGTVQLGDSGDTFTIPAGATITNNGTAAGFGATGAVSWDTTVKTSGFTAVSGVGYFVDTTSGAISVNLPAGTAGAVVGFKDYANTFDTNAVTLVQNGSDKIGGSTVNATLSTEGLAVTLVYVDATQGWLVTDNGTQDTASTAQYVTATGGTITTCGDYKIHTFTGPGTLCVSCAGNACGSNSVDYLVVAGGAGGSFGAGGGGAGGFRESHSTPVSGCYTASPLATPTGITVSATTYPITIGGGGAGSVCTAAGCNGNNSVFSTITSTGGGGGARYNGGFGPYPVTGNFGGPGNGGSGGGGGGVCVSGDITSGTGNTPPVSPPQGSNGGNGFTKPAFSAGGGGGATEAGQNAPGNKTGGRGGTGATTSISSSPIAYAGGGGAGSDNRSNNPNSPITAGAASPCGTGAAGGYETTGSNGTTNRGGGGGGGGGGGPCSVTTHYGGNGGSGIVIIRYKFQN